MRAPSRARCLTLACASLAALGACSIVPQSAAQTTPQRPTYSSDTSTTAEGTVEVEAGVTADPHDAYSTPVTFKYGLSERSELFVGSSVYNRVVRAGSDPEGRGDLLVGTRHRFTEDDAETALALQLVTKLPTADDSEGLGSGVVDFFGAAIASRALSERDSGTLYYELGVISDPGASDADLQHAVAFALSHGFDGGLGVFAEVAGIRALSGPDPIFATAGLAYSARPDLAIDLAVSAGLNGDAHDTQLLIGVTTNIGRPRRR